MFEPARQLRRLLNEYAIEHYDEGGIHTHSDGAADMCGKWVCASYSKSNNHLSFFDIDGREAAELIRTYDAMQMAKKHRLGTCHDDSD